MTLFWIFFYRLRSFYITVDNLLKKGSIAGVFLRVLQNISEQLSLSKIRKFHQLSWCGSFVIEALQKLWVFTKFPYQENR